MSSDRCRDAGWSDAVGKCDERVETNKHRRLVSWNEIPFVCLVGDREPQTSAASGLKLGSSTDTWAENNIE